MKSWILRVLAIALFVPGIGTQLFAQQPDEEQKLIQILQSNASLADKDAACARLKWIGTARSVPVLSTLLRDDQLSHSARYALESMQSAEAEAALLGALNQTTGPNRIGIINSLGVRGASQASPALAVVLTGQEVPAAIAAAKALGQIGDPQALAALQRALNDSSGKLHEAVVDGLLHTANSLMASGNSSKAKPVFEKLYDGKEPDHIKLAAFRGLVLSSGNAGLGQMTHAIVKGPGPSQAAALRLVSEIQATDATEELAKLLPKVKPEIQVALVGALAQRGDPAAAPEIRTLAGNADPAVRPAILNALGLLGNASDVALLSGFAASANTVEQNAARRALAELKGRDVTETLLAQLPTAPASIQAELARALGYRADKSAVPKLLDLAGQPTDSVRKASLKALAQLAGPEDISSLVQLVLTAQDQTARQEASETLNAMYQRFQGSRGPVPVTPLVAGLKSGSPEARSALLPVCSGLAFPDVRLAMRAAIEDNDQQVHSAAVRALCDTVDPELLEDLVNVARVEKQENLRTLAFGGCVRLATQEETVKISRERQVTALKSLLQGASTPEQKRMVLAGLAEVPTSDSLGLIEPLLEDDSVRNEAARAAVKVGLALPGSQAQTTLAVFKKALASPADDATHRAVETALKQIEASADYITNWQVSGPYRQAGKDYAALFDTVFPPEIGDGSGAVWKTLAAGSDPKRPWLMDLLKALGGEQCVAYARTWVRSDQDRPVRLELGSDDGVKVWLNDKQVYALNTARPLQPGSEKVDLNLHSGWNLLLLKITQNNQGWEFCARFLQPDGSHVDGLQCGASAPADSGHAR
jgi:HEAT repeat protein